LWLGLVGCGGKPPTPRSTLPGEAAPSGVVACGRDVPLPVGLPVLSTTLVGTDELQGSCVRGTAAECAFVLDVPTRADLRLSLESLDFDGALVLYEANEGTSELACADDTPLGDSHHSRVEATLEAGRYVVTVEGSAGQGGQFSLFAELDPLPPLSEACARARTLVPGQSLRGSTRGAPNQFAASCAGGAAGPDRGHTFELGTPARVRVRQQSEHDGALHLRTGCDDAATEVACNDDVSDSAHSMLTAELAPGRHYVFSDSFSRAQSGDYVLSLELAEVPPKRGAVAVCAEAERAPLSAGEWELDTFEAPSELASSCGGAGAPERIFTLELASEMGVLMELLDPEFNAVIYVLAECADERSELTCFRAPRVDQAPERGARAPRVLGATLGPGRYAVVVDGQRANDMGAATLHVHFAAMSVVPGPQR
jgi:hypothetical protein